MDSHDAYVMMFLFLMLSTVVTALTVFAAAYVLIEDKDDLDPGPPIIVGVSMAFLAFIQVICLYNLAPSI